jgi:soluble lytic murein transglycosylase
MLEFIPKIDNMGRPHYWGWHPCVCLFLLFLLSLNSCHAQQRSSSDFYEGLKKKQAEAKTEAAADFEKALDNPNINTAAAAAVELMSLHYSGTEIKAAVISQIRGKAPALLSSKAAGSWVMALDALGSGQGGPNREKILALALNNENRSPDDAIQYLLLELLAAGSAGDGNISIISNAENAAIAGRIAVSHSRYREALVFFRMVMADAPELFFQYPELLSDLGRSFQYTETGREGIDLFLQWEKTFDENINDKGVTLEGIIRFRLLFYAARIARSRSDPKNIELFERALPWALAAQNKGEQTDACIWYILNSSLAQDSERTIRLLETYMPHWYDDGYYSDVMDKLARGLLLKRRWTDIIKIFALTQNRPGLIGAKFAWITGRAIQEGLLSPQEMAAAKAVLGAKALGETQDIAEAVIRIAYNNAPPFFDGGALYYRSLSAAAAGEPFLVLPEKPQALQSAKPAQASGESGEMQFLLGFFGNGAAKFAARYIRMMEGGLSPDELRRLAVFLGNEGQYQESMRLVSLYTRQNGYQIQRQDLELLYPRPFIEQVSRYAGETGIAPAKLYGLMRMESAFKADAISRAGAIGLTQLMPATAEETAARILRRGGPDYTRKFDKDSVDEITGDIAGIASPGGADTRGLIANEIGVDLMDPGANIHMGATYLAYLEERMGDPLLAILAYNGGMNRVRRWRNSMPAKFPPDLFLETVEYAETMEYGRAVMGAAAMYSELY